MHGSVKIAGPDRVTLDDEVRDALHVVLHRLTPAERVVFVLHDVEGYTHEEIAGMMGRTASFSKSQLARAHARLRTWLGEESIG